MTPYTFAVPRDNQLRAVELPPRPDIKLAGFGPILISGNLTGRTPRHRTSRGMVMREVYK